MDVRAVHDLLPPRAGLGPGDHMNVDSALSEMRRERFELRFGATNVRMESMNEHRHAKAAGTLFACINWRLRRILHYGHHDAAPTVWELPPRMTSLTLRMADRSMLHRIAA